MIGAAMGCVVFRLLAVILYFVLGHFVVKVSVLRVPFGSENSDTRLLLPHHSL